MRHLVGPEEVATDISSINTLLENLDFAVGIRANYTGIRSALVFDLEYEDAMYTTEQFSTQSPHTERLHRCMAYWKVRLEVPMPQPDGQPTVLACCFTTGMVRAAFNSSTGRLKTLDLRFDTWGLLQQLHVLTPGFCKVNLQHQVTAPSSLSATEESQISNQSSQSRPSAMATDMDM